MISRLPSVDFYNRNRQVGASMVEAAITMPLFLLFLLFIIDIGRYFFVYIFLNFASHNAVSLAARLPIDAKLLDGGVCVCDCQGSTCPPSNPCESYEQYVQMIGQLAVEDALRVASPSGSNGWVELVPFEHYFDSPQDCVSGVTMDVGFMRPGEKVKTGEVEYSHSTRPFGSEPGLGWPGDNESWSGILSVHPLEVRIEALFRPVTPLVPRLRIVASQFAFGSSDAFDEGSSGVNPTPPPDPCEECASGTSFSQCLDCNQLGCPCPAGCSSIFIEEYECGEEPDPFACEDCYANEVFGWCGIAPDCPDTCGYCGAIDPEDLNVEICDQCLGEDCCVAGCQDIFEDECEGKPHRECLDCADRRDCGSPNCGDPCDFCATAEVTEANCRYCADSGCGCSSECAQFFSDECQGQDPLSCENCKDDVPPECPLPDCGDICGYFCEPGTTQDCQTCAQEGCITSACEPGCIDQLLDEFNACKAANPMDCADSCPISDILETCHDPSCDDPCTDGRVCDPPEPGDCPACLEVCGCIGSCREDCLAGQPGGVGGTPFEQFQACEYCNDEYPECEEECVLDDPCVDHPLCQGADFASECATQGHASPFCATCYECCIDQECGGSVGGQ